MKSKNNIICVIPALEKNNYSVKGDLVQWGDTTLIEWKISQALKLKNIKEVIITTPSKKIKNNLKKYNLEILLRKKNLSLSELYKFVGKSFKNQLILWLNPTAPFLSEKEIDEFSKSFKKNKKKYDSAFTCTKIQEFLFNEKKSLNFNSTKLAITRKKIKPIYQSSNGAYINSSINLERMGSLFGVKPLRFKLKWLASLEVKSAVELENFEFLISKYIKENL